MKNFSTVWPRDMVFGRGALNQLGARAKAMNVRRMLIVTDAGLVKCGLAENVAQTLAKDGIESRIFGEVQPNPTMTEVRRGVALWRAESFDGLLALGGGSSMDAAKAIATTLLSGKEIVDQVNNGVDHLPGEPVPFFAVPTTSGTGSEATSAAMVKDDDGRKYLIRSLRCRPVLSVLDPEITASVPARMTAATGMDALIHAMGAYTNSSQHPIADVLALEAIRLVMENLPRAVQRGDDLEARENMMLASHLAGIAISCKGNDAVHGLSTPVESLLDVTHGESLSAILPHVVAFNIEARPDLYATIGRAIGAADKDASDQAAARALLERVTALRDEIGVSRALAPLGVKPEMIERLSELAENSRSTLINCRKMSRSDIQSMYQRML
ncbi:iron-containing alcohol dehydrogenase family protein [Achromobacter sp. RTa]|uniref:iron-containing alcohol dehydrogenase family protein n=1 Tax=Achromobacter sp. RTa TaxID=1532557 RepID=UPI00068A6884|nr:iron-containing alcohol dehydrogenase [Achromobacter sp. RTa]